MFRSNIVVILLVSLLIVGCQTQGSTESLTCPECVCEKTVCSESGINPQYSEYLYLASKDIDAAASSISMQSIAYAWASAYDELEGTSYEAMAGVVEQGLVVTDEAQQFLQFAGKNLNEIPDNYIFDSRLTKELSLINERYEILVDLVAIQDDFYEALDLWLYSEEGSVEESRAEVVIESLTEKTEIINERLIKNNQALNVHWERNWYLTDFD